MLFQEEVAVERVMVVAFLLKYFVHEAELLNDRKSIRYNFHLLNWFKLHWIWACNSTFIPEMFNEEFIS